MNCETSKALDWSKLKIMVIQTNQQLYADLTVRNYNSVRNQNVIQRVSLFGFTCLSYYAEEIWMRG